MPDTHPSATFVIYLCVFVVATLNRETTILVTVIFAVCLFGRLPWKIWRWWIALQVIVFGVIQMAIRVHYADAPGSSIWLRPVENTQLYAEHPIHAWIDASIFAVLGLLIFRNWRHKPIFLRTAFLVSAPLFVTLFIVAGYAFEYRTFGEIFPLALILSMPEGWL